MFCVWWWPSLTGVQQRICLYDYNSLAGAATAAAAAPPDQWSQQQQQQQQPAIAAGLQPLLDLPTASKISSTSFSSAVQQYMLSSNYEGQVRICHFVVTWRLL